MKKSKNHWIFCSNRRYRKKQKSQIRIANQKRQKRNHPTSNSYGKSLRKNLTKKRNAISKEIHSRFSYDENPKYVKIQGSFGLEESDLIDSYLQAASECIDFNSNDLLLDIDETTRIWPSSVVLLCSLIKWVELGRKYNKANQPRVSANDSKLDSVNEYLNHCGFFEYVGRTKKTESEVIYSNDEIVKIKRETSRMVIDDREIELLNLIRKHTKFTESEIELFDSKILTETFNNVIEHGIVSREQGWWLVAQYHKAHKFISLCIADNGIGIKNTLMAGPQSEEIAKKIPNTSDNDGKLVELALTTENTSGAFDASTKDDGIIKKGYKRGARRGNGLNRILDACKQLKIRFSILSHYGFVFVDSNGNIHKSGTKSNRVFGGTMYSFVIPTERGVES